MPLILQLETSTDICSVALCKDGGIIHCVESSDSNSHTENLTILIQECMNVGGYLFNQIDAVALSGGPGSYTSLRIGSATAKGICYAMSCPLITLDSLKILAEGIDNRDMINDDIIIPMIDARRMEVYTAVYDSELNSLASISAVILDEHSFEMYDPKRIHLCGNGAEKYIAAYPSERLKLHHKRTSATFMTKAAMSAYVKGSFSDVAYYSPEYLKAPNITKSLKKIF
jgi:tRNA threonylcarbamoyladenosine biosynthesis protein TsaB